MPVIIHDFDISVQPPEKKQPGAEPADSAKPDATPSLKPEDVARIEQHYRERRRRIHAD